MLIQILYAGGNGGFQVQHSEWKLYSYLLEKELQSRRTMDNFKVNKIKSAFSLRVIIFKEFWLTYCYHIDFNSFFSDISYSDWNIFFHWTRRPWAMIPGPGEGGGT